MLGATHHMTSYDDAQRQPHQHAHNSDLDISPTYL